jgi:hexosaminidase
MRLLFITCCFLAALQLSAQVNIIPAPAEYRAGTGFFSTNNPKGIAIVATQPEAQAAAALLRSAKMGGAALLPEGKTGANAITLRIETALAAKVGQEGYQLEVTSSSMLLRAAAPAGLFYGTQSIFQLIENNKIPACTITDYPRFGWRGLMLDVSRHFFPKEDVKKYIDQMARYKLNTFHWHLTDDNGWRIEIKSLPRLTSVGACRVPRDGRWGEVAAPKKGEAATDCGFYTQDDIREIVQYAAERHITIVPEIDVPGHCLAAIAAYPELACTRDPNAFVNPGSDFSEWYGNGQFKMFIDNTLNPSSEYTYEFLDKVFTEIAALFPGQYIHIGGDECYKGYWESDHGCQALMQKEGMKELHDLQSYFNRRVEKIVQSKGKKFLGWDEILEGDLAPSATVMSWRGVKWGIEGAKQGHPVVMTPTTFCYIDYMQGDPTLEPLVYSWLPLRKVYSFEPVPEGVDSKLILGGQGNLWTEKVPNLRTAQYMTYPRAFAIAEVFWSPKSRKNWDDFTRRVEHEFRYCDAMQLRYSKAMYDAIVWPTMKDNKLMVNLYTEATGQEIYYTLDGTLPDNFSTRYTGPFEVPDAPVTLRVTTYRNGQQTGRTIILTRQALIERANYMQGMESMF